MSQRFTTLDGLRGVAAIAVMFFHFTHHTSVRVFSGASVAVDLFFCMSGFVIAYSYQDRLASGMTVGEFFVKRLVRLYPMFLIGLSLGALALLLKVRTGQTSLGYQEAAQAISLNAFYIPYLSSFEVQIGKDRVLSAIFPSNDPGWSLFFELLVNVIFALLVARFSRLHPLQCVIWGGAALAGYVLWTHQATPGWSATNLMGGLPRTFFGFYAGVYIYFAFEWIGRRAPKINPLWLVAGAIFLMLLPTRFADPAWLFNVLLVVPVLVALCAVSEPQNEATRRVFAYLGWLSYPVYCIHYPVYSLYTSITGNVDGRLPGALVCAAVTLVLAHVTAAFVDEPFRARLSARLFTRVLRG